MLYILVLIYPLKFCANNSNNNKKVEVSLASSLNGDGVTLAPSHLLPQSLLRNYGLSLLVSSGKGSMPSSCYLEPVPHMT